MIVARLLGVAVLLAGMACSTTSSASKADAPGGPDAESVPSAVIAADTESEAASSVPMDAGGETAAHHGEGAADGAAAASQLAPGVAVAELAESVQDRIDKIVAVSKQTLGEVAASFESARAHAADVFLRLAKLRSTLEEVGFTGGAITELDKLEQDAVALNQTSEALRDELRDEQAGLEELSARIEEVMQQVADDMARLESLPGDPSRGDPSSDDPSSGEMADADPANGDAQDDEPSDAVERAAAETMSRMQLRDLDAEAATYDRSGALKQLVQRSDSLVSRVAVLVSRLDRVELQLASVIDTQATAGGLAQGIGAVDDSSASAQTERNDPANEEEDDTLTPKGEIAEITTSQGTLLLQFFPEDAPAHVENFKRLVRDGFYDGLTFHRVLPGYIIQGGCPRGDGLGGPGWQLDNEFNRQPHRRGTLSMARFAHPDSAGSQFFICLDDRPELNGKHTVFGRVINGEQTLSAIEALSDPDGSGTPIEDIQIEKIVLRPWQPGDNETSMIAGNPVR